MGENNRIDKGMNNSITNRSSSKSRLPEETQQMSGEFKNYATKQVPVTSKLDQYSRP